MEQVYHGDRAGMMKDYTETLCRSMSYLGLLGAPVDPGQVVCVHLPPRGCFVILNAAQPGPGPSPGSQDLLLLLLERMLRATESGLQTVLGDKLSTVWVILQQRGRGSSYRVVLWLLCSNGPSSPLWRANGALLYLGVLGKQSWYLSCQYVSQQDILWAL